MQHRDIEIPKVNLNVPAGTAPLTMDLQKFFEFSFWMAEELLDLEAQFEDWKTRASRAPLSSHAVTAKASTHKPSLK